MFKMTETLRTNPNFKVTAAADGTILSIKALVLDFNKAGPNSMPWDVPNSLAAIFDFNHRMAQHGNMGRMVEMYHLGLGKIKGEVPPERWQKIEETAVGAMLTSSLILEHVDGKASTVWVSVEPHGPAAGVFNTLITQYPGTKLTLRIDHDSTLQNDNGVFVGSPNRKIAQVVAVDCIVTVPKATTRAVELANRVTLIGREFDYLDTLVGDLPYMGGLEHSEVYCSQRPWDPIDVADVPAERRADMLKLHQVSCVFDAFYLDLYAQMAHIHLPHDVRQPAIGKVLDALEICTKDLVWDPAHGKATLHILADLTDSMMLQTQFNSLSDPRAEDVLETYRIVIVPLTVVGSNMFLLMGQEHMPYLEFKYQYLEDGSVATIYRQNSNRGIMIRNETDNEGLMSDTDTVLIDAHSS